MCLFKSMYFVNKFKKKPWHGRCKFCKYLLKCRVAAQRKFVYRLITKYHFLINSLKTLLIEDLCTKALLPNHDCTKALFGWMVRRD